MYSTTNSTFLWRSPCWLMFDTHYRSRDIGCTIGLLLMQNLQEKHLSWSSVWWSDAIKHVTRVCMHQSSDDSSHYNSNMSLISKLNNRISGWMTKGDTISTILYVLNTYIKYLIYSIPTRIESCVFSCPHIDSYFLLLNVLKYWSLTHLSE